MIYYYVCKDAEDAMERVVLSPCYPSYEEAYDDFIAMGGLDDNSKLSIEEIREPSIEDEMN